MNAEFAKVGRKSFTKYYRMIGNGQNKTNKPKRSIMLLICSLS